MALFRTHFRTHIPPVEVQVDHTGLYFLEGVIVTGASANDIKKQINTDNNRLEKPSIVKLGTQPFVTPDRVKVF